jgi:hypothetical protein
MPTLLDTSDREALVQRLRRLQPTSRPAWGKFTADKMVCHLADALRVGLGDMTAKPVDNLATRTLVKWIVVHSSISPPKGKIETAPEFLSTVPKTWAEDVAAVEKLIARMATTPTSARHPAFGPLDHAGWCKLSWKHLDHHLRQFGC